MWSSDNELGPKVRVFKPGGGRWILRAIKVDSMTSLEEEVKPSASSREILQHVNNPSKYGRDI
jgi:hypothetical protein